MDSECGFRKRRHGETEGLPIENALPDQAENIRRRPDPAQYRGVQSSGKATARRAHPPDSVRLVALNA